MRLIDYYELFQTLEPDLTWQMIDKINGLKPVDAVPVRHGRWITESIIRYNGKYINIGETMPMDEGIPAGPCSCSECKEWLTASDEYGVFGYYCPHCGAKMDEVI